MSPGRLQPHPCSLVLALVPPLSTPHSLCLSLRAALSPQKDAPCSPHLGPPHLELLIHHQAPRLPPLALLPQPTPAHLPPSAQRHLLQEASLLCPLTTNPLPFLTDNSCHPRGMCLPGHSCSLAGCAPSTAGPSPCRVNTGGPGLHRAKGRGAKGSKCVERGWGGDNILF